MWPGPGLYSVPAAPADTPPLCLPLPQVHSYVCNNITLTFLISIKCSFKTSFFFFLLSSKTNYFPHFSHLILAHQGLNLGAVEQRTAALQGDSKWEPGAEGHRLGISKLESVSKAIDANSPSDA